MVTLGSENRGAFRPLTAKRTKSHARYNISKWIATIGHPPVHTPSPTHATRLLRVLTKLRLRMSRVVVSSLAKSFGADSVLHDVSFRVEADDRIGLVGPNGAGKSTLLLLMAGILEPDAGTVSIDAHTQLGYLPQDADLVPGHTLYEELLATFDHVRDWELELQELAARLSEPAVLADSAVYTAMLNRYAELQSRFEHAQGYTIEQRVSQVLDGLGFTRDQQASPTSHLSGGQRTRAALGKLLLQNADVLLLDEPTNHLDLAALEWLEEYLAAWRGAVVVVSHDRYFLDRVTSRTLEVADGRVLDYPGNYSKYATLRANRLERWAKEYEAQQEYIARTEDFIRRYKAGQRSKEARGRQTLLDRLERIDRPPVDASLNFAMGATIQSGDVVLRSEELAAGFDGGDGAELRVSMSDVEVRRGDRVGLIGPNGAGKTTLLRTIVGQLSPLTGKVSLGHNVHVGYYAQIHDNLNLSSSILDEIRRASHLSEEGARTFLGRFLFFGDDVFKAVGSLSGGERSRVALAKLTLQGANFLVLDEPTNHLDLPARQVLEQLLKAFDGTLLFVSHDRYFVDALATRVWILSNGKVTSYETNYSGYRTRLARDEMAQSRIRDTNRPGTSGGTVKPQLTAPNNSHGAHRSAEHIEVEIVSSEQRIAAMETDLADASAAANVARISELAGEYEREQKLLADLYEEWSRQIDHVS